MKTENVKQTIQELFRQNFNLYPASYPLTESGLATNEASETVADVAKAYFEHRNESEIERDENLGITMIDYVDWCMDEFSSLIAL
jgi:hypothetical protein